MFSVNSMLRGVPSFDAKDCILFFCWTRSKFGSPGLTLRPSGWWSKLSARLALNVWVSNASCIMWACLCKSMHTHNTMHNTKDNGQNSIKPIFHQILIFVGWYFPSFNKCFQIHQRMPSYVIFHMLTNYISEQYV